VVQLISGSKSEVEEKRSSSASDGFEDVESDL
jgi:hypothetical protein